MKVNEVEKECRKLAKEIGAVFKRHDHKINGSPAYYFTNRDSRRVIVSNCTLNTAYDNLLSGFVADQI